MFLAEIANEAGQCRRLAKTGLAGLEQRSFAGVQSELSRL
jgi:hypothetical protein